jgi:uncharacterized protein (DUF1684 family)
MEIPASLRARLGKLQAGFIVSLAIMASSLPVNYKQSIEKWREERESRLKADDGWLTVAGLFWLHDGDNSCGSDPKAEIQLPAGRAPAKVGVFQFHGDKASFRGAPGLAVRINGKPAVGTADLKSDAGGSSPDVVSFADFSMLVIKRGPKYAVRMKDIHSEMRRDFHGLKWYPVKESYRVIAKFTPHGKSETMPIPNILGQTENEPSPGYATFRFKDREYRLDPVLENDRLFFIFRDLTAGKTTYGTGRFLYAEMPKEGKVVLDFNKAYNPPCAFTPYATCPLPPPQNRLNVTIEAGELKYGDH